MHSSLSQPLLRTTCSSSLHNPRNPPMVDGIEEDDHLDEANSDFWPFHDQTRRSSFGNRKTSTPNNEHFLLDSSEEEEAEKQEDKQQLPSRQGRSRGSTSRDQAQARARERARTRNHSKNYTSSRKIVHELDSSDEMDREEQFTRRRRHYQTSSLAGYKQPRTFYISNRREVTLEEKQRAQNLAIRLMCSNGDMNTPMVQVTLLPTHVYHGFHMTIPQSWAMEHMLHKDHDVKLRVPGKEGSWTVGCRWTRQRNCHLRPRWPLFILHNNLEEHDVCVSELVRGGEEASKRLPILNVHIFRAVEVVVPLTVERRRH